MRMFSTPNFLGIANRSRRNPLNKSRRNRLARWRRWKNAHCWRRSRSPVPSLRVPVRWPMRLPSPMTRPPTLDTTPLILHGACVARSRFESELVITDDLTIRGPGADRLAISGEQAVRVLSVLSADLTDPISVDIHKLSITNGLASNAPGFPPEFAFGGGLYNVGSEVSLDHVRMEGNQAGIGGLAAGGAIANEFGGSLSVTHSHFVENSATGFVVAAGGAITSDIGPSLDGNGTPGQPVITITHSTFEGNVARALVADPSTAGSFAPFAGFAFGGAFSNLAGDATVTHSRFVGNSVIGGAGAAGNPGGLANGGAIYSDDFSPFDLVPPLFGRDSNLNVSHSKFVDNHSTGGVGDTAARGGVAAGGAISVSIAFLPESANIRHSFFTHNTATGGAGGAEGGAGGPAIGGALSVLAGADVAVAHSRFSDNQAQGGVGTAGGAGGDGTGGAIGLGRIVTAEPSDLEFLLPSITISHSTLSGNSASAVPLVREPMAVMAMAALSVSRRVPRLTLRSRWSLATEPWAAAAARAAMVATGRAAESTTAARTRRSSAASSFSTTPRRVRRAMMAPTAWGSVAECSMLMTATCWARSASIVSRIN